MRKMSRKIFHKSLHNSCPFFQIAAGGGVGYNSGTRKGRRERMKRWIPIGVVLVLVILAFGLCATAWNPGQFAGDWYCAETGELFRFQDGLVSCEQHNLLTGTIDAMCGAYCFDRDSVTVFSGGSRAGKSAAAVPHTRHRRRPPVRVERRFRRNIFLPQSASGAGKLTNPLCPFIVGSGDFFN